jgi:polyisoprenoid-binding protein YceI
MTIRTSLTALTAALLMIANGTQAATYEVDLAHSDIGFKVKHIFSFVRGSFDDYSGSLEIKDGKVESLVAKATIQTKSINTKNEKRDEHLRSADFFDAEKYPEITFSSTKVESGKDGEITLTGELDMHGVKKEITLSGVISDDIKDPWGMTRRALSLEGTLNRKDFDINFNKLMDNGKLLLGDDVHLEIEIEAVKK